MNFRMISILALASCLAACSTAKKNEEVFSAEFPAPPTRSPANAVSPDEFTANQQMVDERNRAAEEEAQKFNFRQIDPEIFKKLQYTLKIDTWSKNRGEIEISNDQLAWPTYEQKYFMPGEFLSKKRLRKDLNHEDHMADRIDDNVFRDSLLDPNYILCKLGTQEAPFMKAFVLSFTQAEGFENLAVISVGFRDNKCKFVDQATFREFAADAAKK